MPPGTRWNDFNDDPTAPNPDQATFNRVGDLALNLIGGGLSTGGVPGAAGIFGGRLAKTADLEALSVAEKMEASGASMQAIYDATKWFRVPKANEWAFEIPGDAAAKIIGEIGYKPKPLNEILSHPDLFEAYPTFANVKVWNGDFLAGTSVDGFFWSLPDGSMLIFVKREGVATDKFVSNVLHECEHCVQKFEDIIGTGKWGKVNDEVAPAISELRLKMTPENLATVRPFETPGWIGRYRDYQRDVGIGWGKWKEYVITGVTAGVVSIGGAPAMRWAKEKGVTSSDIQRYWQELRDYAGQFPAAFDVEVSP
jgi:hypothetical protein